MGKDKVGKKMKVGFEFCAKGGLRAVVCQAKTQNSHVTLKIDYDIYILIIHCYIVCCFHFWSVWSLNV